MNCTGVAKSSCTQPLLRKSRTGWWRWPVCPAIASRRGRLSAAARMKRRCWARISASRAAFSASWDVPDGSPRPVAQGLDALDQPGDVGGAGNVLHGGGLRSQVHRGRDDAGLLLKPLFDAGGAVGARHPRDGQPDAAGGHVVADGLDGRRQRGDVHSLRVKGDRGPLGSQVDAGAADALHLGKPLFDARRTRRTSCPPPGG